MLTGKIYKNKLSTPEETLVKQTQPQIKSLTRVKSQPGIKYGANAGRLENVENMEQGTVKNQRDKIFGDDTRNQYKVTGGRVLESDVRESTALGVGACDQMLEYERKMREHIQKIQEKYEIRIGYLEATLESKNQIILQLRNALKDKDQKIKQLSQQKHAQTYSNYNK